MSSPAFRLTPIALAGIIGLSLAGTAQADVETRHCSAEAAENLEEAVDFLDEFRQDLKYGPDLAPRRGQRRRIRRRIDRKIDDLWFSCAERVLCRDSAPRIGLHAFGIASDKVRICYDKIVDLRYDFCDFVGVVAHEFGHAVGIPKDRFGGHSRNQDDRVYDFGYFARDLCRMEGRNRRL